MGQNDPAEVLLYRKTMSGWNETLSQGYDTAGPSTKGEAPMLGINLGRLTVFTIRWVMIVIMAGVSLFASKASVTSGESEKVTGMMNVSQRRQLFSLATNAGRGRTTPRHWIKRETSTPNEGSLFQQQRYTALLLSLSLSLFFYRLTPLQSNSALMCSAEARLCSQLIS